MKFLWSLPPSNLGIDLSEDWFLDPDSCPVLGRDEQVTEREEDKEGNNNCVSVWRENVKSYISIQANLYGEG